MYIRDMFKKNKTLISFEIFPPNAKHPIETIYKTIDELQDLKPDYISVTYGAGGTTKSRTAEIAAKIKNEYEIEPLAHLTCITSSKNEVAEVLKDFKDNNVKNILALRGDIPKDFDRSKKLDYHFAKDLITEIKDKNYDFSLGGAFYPEIHSESNEMQDIIHLKEKVDAGAEFLISQLFYDNELFYKFKDKVEQMDIKVPLVAGIMPVLNAKQISKIVELSGCTFPPKFQRIIDKFGDNPEALKEAGIAYAIDQIIDLIASGVDGIHIYTMNKSEPTRKIMEAIKSLR